RLFSAVNDRLRVPLQAVFSGALWLASLANVSYFLFFQQTLELWMVTQLWTNLFEVRNTIPGFFSKTGVVLSTLLFVLSISSLVFPLTQAKLPFRRGGLLRPRRLFEGLGLIVVLLMVRQSPIWFQIPRVHGSVLSEQVLMQWWRTAT